VRATRAAIVVLAGTISTLALATSPTPRHRFVYATTKLADAAEIENLVSLMRRAAAARYDGIVLAESGREGERATDEMAAARIRRVADGLGLEIIPAVFPIGDSRRLLAHDPNLAEGLPVRDALFVVRGGEAELQADPPIQLRGGRLEDFTRWDRHDGNVLVERDTARVDAERGEGKIACTLDVHPFRQYHVVVEVKTEGLDGVPKIVAVGDGKPLNFDDLGLGPSQDWTSVHAIFNSLQARRITLYLTCAHCRSGTLSWRAARMDEIGLLNVVRRAAAPLDVRLEEGAKALHEGRDFAPIADPLLGTVPSPGRYERWHEPPKIRTHGIADGTRLRVSYYHAVVFGHGKVMICPSEPRTMALLRDEARRAHRLWKPKAYFMNHDEVRALGWDESCARRRLQPGAILAENVRACRRILRTLDPTATVYVWSDMFDPGHNARRDYYLVNGDLHGSWDGLDPDVVVAVWGATPRKASLAWFSGRKQPMLIAGYYDTDPSLVRDWLQSTDGVPGVVGFMYTTWKRRYDDLERVTALLEMPAR
jgi:hypothetical protein